MNQSAKAALAAIRKSVELLEVAVSDTEAVPVAVVLTRDRSSGHVHRRIRIEGLPGFWTREGDNLDASGDFDAIPDLSSVGDEQALCRRCFGELDTGGEPVIVGQTDIL